MLKGSLLPFIAGLVPGRERQRHIGAGIGIFAEILHRLADAVAGARIRQHQRKLRRLEQRPRLGLVGLLVLAFLVGFLGRIRVAGGELRARFGDAVIVLEPVGHLQRTAGLAFRILGQ
jgi:hypothetical protein